MKANGEGKGRVRLEAPLNYMKTWPMNEAI